MPIKDVKLTKKYKNGKVLFEEDLDAWRLAAESAFSAMKKNFAQIAKDAFSAGYDYKNTGVAQKPLSLEDRINALVSGGAPFPGTISDTFTINTDGNSATLDTGGLTGNQTFDFPDTSGTFAILEAIQTFTEVNTFEKQIVSTLAIGTAPFSITSTTVVPNLNVNFLQGKTEATLSIAETQIPNGALLARVADNETISGSWTFQNQITSTLASGTSPFAVTSTTVVTNLNSNFLQGKTEATLSIAETQIPNGALLARVADNETISGAWTFPSNNAPAANTTTQQSLIKAWGQVTSAGVGQGYNIDVVNTTRTGVGQYRVYFTVPNVGGTFVFVTPSTGLVGNFTVGGNNNMRVEFIDPGTLALTDTIFNILLVGNQ